MNQSSSNSPVPVKGLGRGTKSVQITTTSEEGVGGKQPTTPGLKKQQSFSKKKSTSASGATATTTTAGGEGSGGSANNFMKQLRVPEKKNETFKHIDDTESALNNFEGANTRSVHTNLGTGVSENSEHTVRVAQQKVAALKGVANSLIDALDATDTTAKDGYTHNLQHKLDQAAIKALTNQIKHDQQRDRFALNFASNKHQITEVLQNDPVQTAVSGMTEEEEEAAEQRRMEEVRKRIRTNLLATMNFNKPPHQRQYLGKDGKVKDGDDSLKFERRSPIIEAYKRAMAAEAQVHKERIEAAANERPLQSTKVLHTEQRAMEIKKIIEDADHPAKLVPIVWQLSEQLTSTENRLMYATLHIERLNTRFNFFHEEFFKIKGDMADGIVGNIKDMRDELDYFNDEKEWLYKRLKLMDIQLGGDAQAKAQAEVEFTQKLQKQADKQRQQNLFLRVGISKQKRLRQALVRRCSGIENQAMAAHDTMTRQSKDLEHFRTKYLETLSTANISGDQVAEKADELEQILKVRRHYLVKNSIIFRVCMERLQAGKDEFVKDVIKRSGVLRTTEAMRNDYINFLEKGHVACLQSYFDMYQSLVEDMSPFIDHDLATKWTNKDDPVCLHLSQRLTLPNPYSLYVAAADVLRDNWELIKETFVLAGKGIFDRFAETLSELNETKERLEEQQEEIRSQTQRVSELMSEVTDARRAVRELAEKGLRGADLVKAAELLEAQFEPPPPNEEELHEIPVATDAEMKKLTGRYNDLVSRMNSVQSGDRDKVNRIKQLESHVRIAWEEKDQLLKKVEELQNLLKNGNGGATAGGRKKAAGFAPGISGGTKKGALKKGGGTAGGVSSGQSESGTIGRRGSGISLGETERESVFGGGGGGPLATGEESASAAGSVTTSHFGSPRRSQGKSGASSSAASPNHATSGGKKSALSLLTPAGGSQSQTGSVTGSINASPIVARAKIVDGDSDSDPLDATGGATAEDLRQALGSSPTQKDEESHSNEKSGLSLTKEALENLQSNVSPRPSDAPLAANTADGKQEKSSSKAQPDLTPTKTAGAKKKGVTNAASSPNKKPTKARVEVAEIECQTDSVKIVNADTEEVIQKRLPNVSVETMTRPEPLKLAQGSSTVPIPTGDVGTTMPPVPQKTDTSIQTTDMDLVKHLGINSSSDVLKSQNSGGGRLNSRTIAPETNAGGSSSPLQSAADLQEAIDSVKKDLVQLVHQQVSVGQEEGSGGVPADGNTTLIPNSGRESGNSSPLGGGPAAVPDNLARSVSEKDLKEFINSAITSRAASASSRSRPATGGGVPNTKTTTPLGEKNISSSGKEAESPAGVSSSTPMVLKTTLNTNSGGLSSLTTPKDREDSLLDSLSKLTNSVYSLERKASELSSSHHRPGSADHPASGSPNSLPLNSQQIQSEQAGGGSARGGRPPLPRSAGSQRPHSSASVSSQAIQCCLIIQDSGAASFSKRRTLQQQQESEEGDSSFSFTTAATQTELLGRFTTTDTSARLGSASQSRPGTGHGTRPGTAQNRPGSGLGLAGSLTSRSRLSSAGARSTASEVASEVIMSSSSDDEEEREAKKLARGVSVSTINSTQRGPASTADPEIGDLGFDDEEDGSGVVAGLMTPQKRKKKASSQRRQLQSLAAESSVTPKKAKLHQGKSGIQAVLSPLGPGLVEGEEEDDLKNSSETLEERKKKLFIHGASSSSLGDAKGSMLWNGKQPLRSAILASADRRSGREEGSSHQLFCGGSEALPLRLADSITNNHREQYAQLSLQVVTLHRSLSKMIRQIVAMLGLSSVVVEEPVMASEVYNGIKRATAIEASRLKRESRRLAATGDDVDDDDQEETNDNDDEEELLSLDAVGSFAVEACNSDRNLVRRIRDEVQKKWQLLLSSDNSGTPKNEARSARTLLQDLNVSLDPGPNLSPAAVVASLDPKNKKVHELMNKPLANNSSSTGVPIADNNLGESISPPPRPISSSAKLQLAREVKDRGGLHLFDRQTITTLRQGGVGGGGGPSSFSSNSFLPGIMEESIPGSKSTFLQGSVKNGGRPPITSGDGVNSGVGSFFKMQRLHSGGNNGFKRGRASTPDLRPITASAVLHNNGTTTITTTSGGGEDHHHQAGASTPPPPMTKLGTTGGGKTGTSSAKRSIKSHKSVS